MRLNAQNDRYTKNQQNNKYNKENGTFHYSVTSFGSLRLGAVINYIYNKCE